MAEEQIRGELPAASHTRLCSPPVSSIVDGSSRTPHHTSAGMASASAPTAWSIISTAPVSDRRFD